MVAGDYVLLVHCVMYYAGSAERCDTMSSFDLVGIEESNGEQADDGDGFREDLARPLSSGLSFVSLLLRRRAVSQCSMLGQRVNMTCDCERKRERGRVR